MAEVLERRTLLSADVLAYHNDSASTGQNLSETLLTPGNVNVASFGRRFTTSVDGQVYAQPLFVSGLNVTVGPTPGIHDVVFAATEHNSLYAVDSDSGQILWQTSFINPAQGITSVPSSVVNTNDLTPEIGITGTPVIDRNAGVLFVAAKTQQIVGGDTNNPHYLYTLYKVNIADGTYTSTVIADTTRTKNGYTYNSGPYVVGKGDGAITVNGQSRVYFNALREMNRPGLVLLNGSVYIAFASHGDNGPYHGWILGYNENTLANTAAFNTTPNGGLGGIWQSGGSITIDPQGFMYVETGNGSFDTSFDANGLPVNGNYGDSFIKIALDATTTQSNQNINGFGLKAVDFFTPFNQGALDSADRDLGSGGPMVLPDSVGTLAHPHLLIGSGKEGKLYLIDRDKMGEFDPLTDHVLQEQGSAINGSLDTPAFFSDGTTSKIYYVGGYGDRGKAYTIANASFSSNPTSQTPDSFAFPGSTPSISANGTNNGIVWDLERQSGQLRAYSAASYANELWTSAQAPNNRDQLGNVTKFSVPTVANGHVYVGTVNALVGYGPPQPPTAVPATPTPLVATTLSAVQIGLTWKDVATNEDGYTIEKSKDGGQTWTTIATGDVNAQSYTVSGLTAGGTYTFRVRAFNALGPSAYSNTVTATTSSQLPAVDFSSGFSNAGGALTLNGSAVLTGSRLELTTGATGQAGSAFTTSPLFAGRFNTSFTFQLTKPAADGFAFVLQNGPATALGGAGGDLGYGGIGSSIAIKFDFYENAGEGADSTGLFTGGAHPYKNANTFDLSAANVSITNGAPMRVTLSYDGTTLTETVNDGASNATFTKSYAIDIPSILLSGSARIGFTGGTGGGTAIQDITSWIYTPLPTSAPAAPFGLSVVPASGTQLNLTWSEDPSQQVDGYKIFRRIGTTGTFTEFDEVPANPLSYMNTALDSNTDYYYEIVATNSVGDSLPSALAHALTPVAPLTPINTHTTAIGTNVIDLAWTALATNDDGYKVLRKKATDGDNQFAQVASLPAGASSYHDTGVLPGITYDYHIQAYNLAGYSDFTGITVSTLALSPPAAPTAVTPLSGIGQISLSWTAPAGAVTYNVYRSTVSGQEKSAPALATGLGTAAYVNTGLTGGTKFYYLVTAVGPGGESVASAEVSAVVGSAPPAAPTALKATAAVGQVSLSWTAPAGTVTYNVYRSTVSGQEKSAPAIATALNTAAYVNTGLTGGTKYYYVVTAVGAGGEGPASAEASAVAGSSVDATAPLASLPAQTLTAGGGNAFTFTVQYSDNVAVRYLSLDGSDLQVIGPAGSNYSVNPTFVGSTPAADAAGIVATYSIPGPGGTWDAADNGFYVVTLQSGQVLDATGNSAGGGVLGSLQVSIAATNAGLLAQYNFDETGGTSAADASGNGLTGTLLKAPGFVAGHTGNALSFNGNNQAVSIPSSPILNQTGGLTLSAWINAADWQGNRRIMQKGANDDQFRLLAENGLLKFDLKGVGVVTASLPSTNIWHLVTGTWDGTTMQLYVDGKVVASAARHGTINLTVNPLIIGGKTATGKSGNFFSGLIDDVRIYGRGLSTAEVQGLYGAPVVTPPALVAQYTFDESAGTTASDSTGNNNQATLVNGASFVPATHGTGNGNALSLSGAGQYARVPNSSSLNPSNGITLSAWVNAADWKGNRRIVQKGVNDNQYRLLAENGKLKFDLSGVGVVTATLPSTNTWHLITGTWNGNKMTLYVDGQSVASGNFTALLAVTADVLTIGAKNTTSPASGNFFKGMLDDVRIYSGALLATDVQALYAAG